MHDSLFIPPRSHQAGLHGLLARLPDEVRRPPVLYADRGSLALVGALYEGHHLIAVSVRVPEQKLMGYKGGVGGRKTMSGGAGHPKTKK